MRATRSRSRSAQQRYTGSICRQGVVSIAKTRTSERGEKPMIHRRQLLGSAAALAGTAALGAAGACPALAQGATEVSFFYPIAVGGPITKLIDAYAADFEKQNPSIKVKPIYS